METKKRHPAWRMLLVGILLYFGGQGCIAYSVGLYIVPITTAHNIGVGVFSTAMAVGSISMIIYMAFVGKIMQKVPLKMLMIISSVIQCSAFILLGQVKSTAALYILLPLMYIGGAIPNSIIGPMLITNWFEAKRGFAIGLMTAFGNIGAVVSSQLAGYIMSTSSYSTATLVMGAGTLVLSITAAFLAIAHPAQMGLRALGAAEIQSGADTGNEEIPGITSSVALKSPTFYITFFTVLLLIFCASFTTFLSPLAMSLGLDVSGASNVVSLQQIGALLGALIIGMLNDKIGVKKTSVSVFSMFAVTCLAIYLLGSNVTILYVLVVVLGFCTSTGGSQPAMLTGKLFGQKEYSSIFSKVTMAMSSSSLIAMPFYGFMYDLTSSYLTCLIVLFGIGLVMTALVFAAFGSAKKLWIDNTGMEMPAA